ncbi:MAG: hypothetical protein WD851_13035 [Pirellulales bacterium]
MALPILNGSCALAFQPSGEAIFFDGLPTIYTPGSAIVFKVGLPAIANLGAYNVDLILTSDAGVAGIDYFFDVAATTPVAQDYVFPFTANYFDAANVDSPSQHRLTLTDFDLDGVDVVSGANEFLVVAVIRSADDFAGSLMLSVDVAGLILDTPSIVPTPVDGFDAIRANTEAGGPALLTAVPEPKALACALTVAGGLALMLVSCRRLY